MKWLNEPLKWSEENGIIQVTSSHSTDFWQKTHYGFVRDNGHFYGEKVSGDFVASVKVSGKYQDLYDQAGLMVRLDKENWIKCGIELVEGVQQASTVVTRDYSDWSVVPMPDNPASTWLRIIRKGAGIKVYYSQDNVKYTMMRTTYLTSEEEVEVGIMCASPKGEGFLTIFEDFEIQSSLDSIESVSA